MRQAASSLLVLAFLALPVAGARAQTPEAPARLQHRLSVTLDPVTHLPITTSSAADNLKGDNFLQRLLVKIYTSLKELRPVLRRLMLVKTFHQWLWQMMCMEPVA